MHRGPPDSVDSWSEPNKIDYYILKKKKKFVASSLSTERIHAQTGFRALPHKLGLIFLCRSICHSVAVEVVKHSL